MLTDAPEVSVQTLTDRLGVSGATVRRDLVCMEDSGLVRRSYGKVISLRPNGHIPISLRYSEESDAKRRIGALAASLVPGDPVTVVMSGGTTVRSVAQCLAARAGLRVVTNSLATADPLLAKQRVDVVVTGGLAHPSSQQLVGDLTIATLRRYRYDLAVIGVKGICWRHGLATDDGDAARASHAMVERSQRVIVVADSSKIGCSRGQRICGIEAADHKVGLEAVDHIVTDSRASRAELAGLRLMGLDLVLAAMPSTL